MLSLAELTRPYRWCLGWALKGCNNFKSYLCRFVLYLPLTTNIHWPQVLEQTLQIQEEKWSKTTWAQGMKEGVCFQIHVYFKYYPHLVFLLKTKGHNLTTVYSLEMHKGQMISYRNFLLQENYCDWLLEHCLRSPSLKVTHKVTFRHSGWPLTSIRHPALKFGFYHQTCRWKLSDY